MEAAKRINYSYNIDLVSAALVNGFRDDLLNAYQFETLEQLRIVCAEWVYDYNYLKPHSAHRGMVPAMIAKEQETFTNRTMLIQEISLN